MAILNPGFEDVGAISGEAEHWNLVTFVAAERIAGFGPAPHRAWEGFERWADFTRSFAPGELAVGFFDPLAEGYEDFEDSWDNDFYLFELPTGHVVVCPFSGGAVEDMESGWLVAAFAWSLDEVATTTGEFDGEDREDFEEQWRGNESYAWSLVEVTTEVGLFDGEDAEDFEDW